MKHSFGEVKRSIHHRSDSKNDRIFAVVTLRDLDCPAAAIAFIDLLSEEQCFESNVWKRIINH